MRIACSLLFFLAACSSSPAATDAGPDGSAVDAAPDVEGFDAPALDAPEDVVGAEAAADAPADVPASFDPTQLPNLALWLRSDLGVTASGTAVIAWADQSGNHNDFADDGTSPILQAKAFNGLPAVDALNTRMSGKASSIGTGAFVYEVVIGAVGYNQFVFFEQCGLGNANQINLYTPTSGAGISLGLMGQGKPDSALFSPTNVEDGAAHFIGVTRDANGTIALRVDGLGASTLPSWAVDYQDLPGALISGGSILEEVIYAGALDAQQLGQLESYFESRYAL